MLDSFKEFKRDRQTFIQAQVRRVEEGVEVEQRGCRHWASLRRNLGGGSGPVDIRSSGWVSASTDHTA